MSGRAILFDLDETLYRERRFALGGFAAVAEAVERSHGVGRHWAFACLATALRQGRRPQAFQDLCERFDLPSSCIPAWVRIYRAHAPRLRLPQSTRAALATLRPCWRIGILTNGLRSVQARKVRALGLVHLVDVVVFAQDFGGGKPSAAAFQEALARLGSDPWTSVFAGDDPWCDIDGARRVGMQTVLIRHGCQDISVFASGGADAVVPSIACVPDVAERLLAARWLAAPHGSRTSDRAPAREDASHVR